MRNKLFGLVATLCLIAFARPAKALFASGFVFEDVDGSFQRSPGDVGIEGVTIELTNLATNEVFYTASVTNGSWYSPIGMPDGDYFVRQVPYRGYVPTYPPIADDYIAYAGQDYFDLNFALQRACVPPPSGMRAWWSLDQISGPLVDDRAGTNNFGFRTAGFDPATGIVGGAAILDGIGRLSVTDHAELDFGTGDLTIDAWVRTTQNGVAPIVDKRTGNNPIGPIGYLFFLYNGRPGFQLADRMMSSDCGAYDPNAACTNYIAPNAFKINDGQWHHVAVTVDRDQSNGGRLFVDGAVVHTFDPRDRALSIDNNTSLVIGRDRIGDDRFVGGLDEIELFDRALTAAEIERLATARSSGKCKTPCSVPSLIQSNYFPTGNFEVVAPTTTAGFRHLWRHNDADGLPWYVTKTVGEAIGRVDAAAMIQRPSSGIGDFEIVVRHGDQLSNFRRANNSQAWSGPFTIASSGVRGTPSLLDNAPDFDLVVPLVSGGIAHYRSSGNAVPLTWGTPVVFAAGEGVFDDVVLMQGPFGALEVVARTGDRLAYFYSDLTGANWSTARYFATGVTGAPGAVMPRDDLGNIIVVAPVDQGGLVSWYFEKYAGPGSLWLGPSPPFGSGYPNAVSLIESNYGKNLEVIAEHCGRMTHWWRDSTFDRKWHGEVSLP
jgi:concanavalin A-like lectin/glucanase superfamily protein